MSHTLPSLALGESSTIYSITSFSVSGLDSIGSGDSPDSDFKTNPSDPVDVRDDARDRFEDDPLLFLSSAETALSENSDLESSSGVFDISIGDFGTDRVTVSFVSYAKHYCYNTI